MLLWQQVIPDAENFRKKGANAFCITNGFDSEVKSQIREVVESVDNKNDLTTSQLNDFTEKFTLSYIGVLEQLRNPEILWETLNDLVQEKCRLQKRF